MSVFDHHSLMARIILIKKSIKHEKLIIKLVSGGNDHVSFKYIR